MKAPYKHIKSELAEKYKLAQSPREAKSPNLRNEVKDEDTILTDGAATMSNQPIAKSTKITFSQVPADERGREDYHTRIAQNVNFANGLQISNVHFASNNNSWTQLNFLIQNTENSRIILGDFNMTKNLSLLKHRDIWETNYNASIEFSDYISFPNNPPEYQVMDYMLLPKIYEFISVRAVGDLSDHNAMIYEIK
jgi:endonuclease/exonuclease/phosphatase family metal-dependent hydrolase